MTTSGFSNAIRQPVLFVSHGAPTYALTPGLAGQQLCWVGQQLERPAAVLVLSPHWITDQPCVAVTPAPLTIHDFGGFDPALYRLTYPAVGHPELAAQAIELLNHAGWRAQADSQWGLDHGAWIPLRHLFPQANIPVYQVSMPASLDEDAALAYGQALAPLADKGVLIVGSGSLTHNLFEFRTDGSHEADYAKAFVAWIRNAAVSGNSTRLLRALELAPYARRAHPTKEHYLPLLIALGAAHQELPMTVLPGGITHGVLSMESYLFGKQLVGLPTNEVVAPC